MKNGFINYYVIFFVYFLDALLFFIFNNKYFQTFSLAADVVFIYFVSSLLSIEEMVIFSVVPIFFSFLFVELYLSVIVLLLSFLVVFFYSDLNIIFANISYIAAFISSYLLKQSLKQKELIKKQREFDKEFNDKITIAKRLSLEFAHEIRNPLMGISGSIEILKESKDEKTKKNMIDIAEQEIERANNLIRDFLNLEKPHKIYKRKFDICDFLYNFALENDNLIKIAVQCKERYLPLNGDREMIRRMFSNLIRNSIEAKSQNVTIDVSSNDKFVILIVKDDGVGINVDDSDANNIFLPFFTTKEQGSGLGLSICKQIVNAHLGSIDIYSKNAFIIKLKRF